ncbi:MAG: pirin family protein [Candidatus Cybelea sp.]
MTGETQPVFDVQRAAERATYDHGWLLTSHSFSFAEYFDPRNVNWSALRVVNDDRVAPGAGFPTHPHRDMEIVTYVLSGELEHRDSMGNHGVVGPGGVQYMSAGSGVRHSEYNHSSAQRLHFLQMWVLPGEIGGPPTYGQVDFDAEERRNKWLVIASGHAGQEASVTLTQDAMLLVSRLEGEELRHTFEPGRLGFLFVADGDVEVAAFDPQNAAIDSTELTAGDAIRLAGVTRLKLSGVGEVVLWDLPRAADDANDYKRSTSMTA